MTTTRARRGQATVELALGSLLFVVVLLGGIAFAEIGQVMLKTKEAAAFAMHHATGERAHSFSLGNITAGQTFDPFDPSRTATQTQTRYADFDGTRTTGAGTKLTLARATDFDADCDETRANALTFSLGGGGPANVRSYLNGIYQPRGGVSCLVRARVELVQMPRGFVEGSGGFSQERLWSRMSIATCGVGLPNRSGACRGRLDVLTGDWGFDGVIGSNLNDDVPRFHEGYSGNVVNNQAYRRLVNDIFDVNGRGQGNASDQVMDFLEVPAGADERIDVNAFNMSFRGANGVNPVRVRREKPDPRAGNIDYQTSGAYIHSTFVDYDVTSYQLKGVNRGDAKPCYLGLPGCE